MERVSAADFQRHVGRYQDWALVDPVIVTRNGRDRLVLLSADEYHRLAARDRQVLITAQLSPAMLSEIAAGEMSPEHAHLNDELFR